MGALIVSYGNDQPLDLKEFLFTELFDRIRLEEDRIHKDHNAEFEEYAMNQIVLFLKNEGY